MSFLIPAAFAADAAPAAGAPAGTGFEWVFLVGFLVIFYLMIWRPQAKRAKEQKNLLGGLQKGDEVVTARHMENIMAPPFWRMALRGNNLADDVPVDRWQICRFSPPSHPLRSASLGPGRPVPGFFHSWSTQLAGRLPLYPSPFFYS